MRAVDPELLRLVPCFGCQHPAAGQALCEIAQVYIEIRRGAPPPVARDGRVLPLACCKRRAGPVDVTVLVA